MSWIDERNVRRLDGSLLLVFRELVRHQKTTAAGDRLGLSQSGVSHALKRLRDIFDDPLFIRRPFGLEPTRRALELAPRIEALIALATEAVAKDASYNPAQSARQFLIGSLENLIPSFAIPLIRAFEVEAPHASAVFRFYLPEDAPAALLRGDVDLAVGAFDEPPLGLVRELLLRDEYVVVARQGHAALGAPLTPESYSDLPQVVVSPDGSVALPIDGHLAERGLRRKVRAAVPRLMTAFAIVGSTDVVLTAPRHVAEQYAEAFSLAITPLPAERISLDIYVLRAAPSGDAAIDWLVDKVRNAIDPLRCPQDRAIHRGDRRNVLARRAVA